MIGAPTALRGAVVGTPRRAVPGTALALLTVLGVACGGETTIAGVSHVVASLTITAESHGMAGGAPTQPGTITMEVGDSVGLSATATNALGLAVSGVTAVWSSSAPATVTVSGTGVATALAPGSADVFAAVDGVSAAVRIVVPDPVTVPPPTPTG